MKRLLLLAASLYIGACNTTSHSTISKETETTIKHDSVQLYCIYNDSVDYILMHPSKVKVYQMVGLIRDSAYLMQKDSLFNYLIDKDLGKLNKGEKYLLHFIISNIQQYRTNYAQIRQPFNPDFTLEFIKEKQIIFFFVSFGTGEIAIADITGHFKFYFMSDAYIMKRWYNYIITERTKHNSTK